MSPLLLLQMLILFLQSALSHDSSISDVGGDVRELSLDEVLHGAEEIEIDFPGGN